MKDFAREVRKYVPTVMMTVVDTIPKEEIEACRKICERKSAPCTGCGNILRTEECDETMIGALIMGALVGWIAGKLMGVEGGLLRNIIIGVVGSFVGSGLFSLLGFYAYGLLAQILTGVVGACVFIWVGRRLLH